MKRGERSEGGEKHFRKTFNGIGGETKVKDGGGPDL